VARREREGQRGRGSARNIVEGNAVIGADLSLYRGNGIGRGGRGEGGGLADGHVQVAVVARDRRCEFHRERGSAAGGRAGAVGGPRLIPVAVWPGRGGEG